MADTRQYEMKISRLTVDKLGVKLYDRVALVIAEIVSNSYDADAESVFIEAPMGEYLAVKDPKTGKVKSKDTCIKITDNGMGMTPDELQEHYLIVGKDRRDTSKGGRGDVSPKWNRKVMGRKGIGKLAPFGVCRFIEVISSGGESIQRVTEDGVTEEGYLTAHVILDREEILSDTEITYKPETGQLDGAILPKSGTTVILRGFEYRMVPTIENLNKQLAQRFGITSSHWSITLKDTTKSEDAPDYSLEVGALEINLMPNSKLSFEGPRDSIGMVQKGDGGYSVKTPEGAVHPTLKAGFEYEGKFYPISGWVGYSKTPYKDDLMVGVRIYCRGKIAAQTSVFNMKAGFTGEHSIRSYLVGELHAEWLDENEDLIHTDRRDILWSHELGQKFQEWGRGVVRVVGNITRDPVRQQTWEVFQETGRIDERVKEAFPHGDQKDIRSNAKAIAKQLGRTVRPEEASDSSVVDSLVDLSLMLAPHLTLDDMLREASNDDGTPFSAIGSILKTARVAELSSFGRIAKKRIDVIQRLMNLKDMEDTDEAELQKLLEEAPWLINPRWAPITANQSLTTLKREIPKYFKKKFGIDVNIGDFKKAGKRPDFVLSGHDGKIRIIEIKKPDHAFENVEMERLANYYEAFKDFIENPLHKDMTKEFSDFQIILVCDKIKLTSLHRISYDGMVDSGRLTHITWMNFLSSTEQHHKDFLLEADRQSKLNLE